MTSSGLAARTAFYGLFICWWAFALTFWLRKGAPRAPSTKRDPASYLGLLLQAAGYFLVWLRPLEHRESAFLGARPAWSAWAATVASLGIAAASVVLVIWSARCLGKQWSLEARLVEGHDLIEDGPYRFVRNPIYAGMFGLLIGTGLATTEWRALLAAVVLFGIGTWIRVRIEERLLREKFRERFEDYARRVSALIPGVY